MVAIVARSGQWPWRRLGRRDLLLAMTVPGLVAALGSMAFNRGSEVRSVSITAAASSIYPLVAVTAGVFLLHERLRPRQAVAWRPSSPGCWCSRGGVRYGACASMI